MQTRKSGDEKQFAQRMFVASCDGRKANLPSRLIFQAKPFWKASSPCAFSMRSAKPIFRMLHLSVDDCERYLIPLVLAFSRSASAQSLSCQDFTASFSLNFSYLNSYQAWSLEEKSIEDSFASVITTASIAFLNSNQNRCGLEYLNLHSKALLAGFALFSCSPLRRTVRVT